MVDMTNVLPAAFIGTQEWILILLVVLLLFGARRIPDIARALGRASHEFKKAKNEIANETDELMREAEQSAAKDDAKTAARTDAAASGDTDSRQG